MMILAPTKRVISRERKFPNADDAQHPAKAGKVFVGLGSETGTERLRRSREGRQFARPHNMPVSMIQYQCNCTKRMLRSTRVALSAREEGVI